MLQYTLIAHTTSHVHLALKGGERYNRVARLNYRIAAAEAAALPGNSESPQPQDRGLLLLFLGQERP